MSELFEVLKMGLKFSINISLVLLAILMMLISFIGTIANIRTKNIYGIIISISFAIVSFLIFKFI